MCPDVLLKEALILKGLNFGRLKVASAMFPFNSPYNYLLYWSLICAIGPWLYSYFNEQRRESSMTVEQAMLMSWDRVINLPTIKFRKIIVGINCNVDVVLSGVSLINHLNASSPNIGDREVLNSVNDLYETFTHFFSKGAPAERYMANDEVFKMIVAATEDKFLRAQHYTGGNAALMAQKIASSFPAATVFLVGSIGPRSNVLLHPAIVRNNSTRIVQDELHLILEYKQGEILGEYVAPASSRFITSHDLYSASSLIIEMFFKAIGQFHPDLIIFSGVHLLEAQTKEIRTEKLRLIKRSLAQINPLIPIHLQLGNMGDSTYIEDVLDKIIPYVDSLSLNEQELVSFSRVGNGPYHAEQFSMNGGTLHAHKVVDMLYWLMTTYGHNKTNPEASNYQYRLQRIHFHCLTYHIVVSRGTDWSNLASGLAAGARLAGRQACNMASERTDFDLLEVRTSDKIMLDKQADKVYNFNSHNPIASWMRNDVIFIYTPVLVCKYPHRTVGIDDAISATALLYSQFYKLERVHW